MHPPKATLPSLTVILARFCPANSPTPRATSSFIPSPTMARQLRSSSSSSSSSKPIDTPAQTPAPEPAQRPSAPAKPKKRRVAPKAASPTTPSGSSPPTGLVFPSLAAFETFLSANHASLPSGVWLRLAKKSHPSPSLTYQDALDGALCWGWIDGQRKALPDQPTLFAQRFTPRRQRGQSLWSKRNVDRVAELVEQGRMRPPGQAQVDAAKADGRWERAYVGPKDMRVPDDFVAVMRESKSQAEEIWEGLGKSQRYGFLLRIETAKTPETRQKRIQQCVESLAQGKTP